MKIVASIYLLGFITAWAPIVMLMLVNMTPLTKISADQRVDLFGYAARATLTGFWVMIAAGFMLVAMAIVETVKYLTLQNLFLLFHPDKLARRPTSLACLWASMLALNYLWALE